MGSVLSFERTSRIFPAPTTPFYRRIVLCGAHHSRRRQIFIARGHAVGQMCTRVRTRLGALGEHFAHALKLQAGI